MFYAPGRVVNRMTGVFRGEAEAETDTKDAQIIAETATAELAVLVIDTWQRRGLGTILVSDSPTAPPRWDQPLHR